MELTLPLLSFLILFLAKIATKKYALSPLEKQSPWLPLRPWRLPLVGSLHHVLLLRYGGLPHWALRELTGRHGPLMLLHFGVVRTLVISSAEATREIMKMHDITFASCHLTPTIVVFNRGGHDILFSPYGDLWHQFRRLCVLELFSVSCIQSIRHIHEDEATRILHSITDECARGGGFIAVVNIGERISCMINDTMVRSSIGGQCTRCDEFLLELNKVVQLTGGFNLADLYPSSRLARLLCGALRETQQCNQNAHEILDCRTREHAQGTDDGDTEEEDLLGMLPKL